MASKNQMPDFNEKITKDTVLEFGKHKGQTIGWVIENDASYIIWLEDEGVLSIPSKIYNEALDSNSYRDYEDEGMSWGDFNT